MMNSKYYHLTICVQGLFQMKCTKHVLVFWYKSYSQFAGLVTTITNKFLYKHELGYFFLKISEPPSCK